MGYYTGNQQPPLRPGQTPEQAAAEAQWNAQAPGVYQGADEAHQYYDASQQGTTGAFAQLNGFTPGQTPLSTRLAQYDPTASYAWMNGAQAPQIGAGPGAVSQVRYNAPAAVGGAGAGVAAYRPDALSGFSAGAAGYTSQALKDFSSGDVSSFDPSAAGSTWAKGAYGDFSKNLQLQLDKLQNSSVAAGRTNSNLYDRDTGLLVNKNASDFSNALAQEAGVFSGQRLQALTSGAQMRLAQAQGIDANMLSATQSADQAMLARAQGIDANRLQAGTFSASLGQAAQEFNAEQQQAGNTFALNRAGMVDQNALARDTANLSARGQWNTTRAGASAQEAQLGFEKGSALDTAANTRAFQNDQLSLAARSTGLSAALQREAGARDAYNSATGRADAYTSASRNWAASDQQTAFTQEQQRQATGFAGMQYWQQQQAAADAKRKTDAANQKVAQSVGAAYYG